MIFTAKKGNVLFPFFAVICYNGQKEGGGRMIDVTRMNDKTLTLNSDLIESVEETPDTVITLTTGKKIIVKESRQEIKNLVKLYRKEIFQNM